MHSLTSPYIEILSSQDDTHLLHALREKEPVHFVPSQQLWFVSSHEHVKALYSDEENVTQDARAWSFYNHRSQSAGGSLFDEFGPGSLKPEGHKRLRRLFIKAFTSSAVRRMEHQIHEVVQRYAQPLRSRHGEVIDLMGEFTKPIPTVVVGRIMGVGLGDDERHFCKLAQQIFMGFFPMQPPEVLARANSAFAELADWVRTLAVSRVKDPQDDLISNLMAVRDEGDQLEPDDIIRLITSLLAAGTETTARGGQAILDVLFNHPEYLEPVRKDPTLVQKAVSECLRWGFDGADFIIRYAAKDFQLNSKLIRKGQMIMLSAGGANKDPLVFQQPDVFDLERDQKQSLVFGHGAHYCIGAQLARAELGYMLEAIMEIAPRGSKVRKDLMRYEDNRSKKRSTTFPVEIAV